MSVFGYATGATGVIGILQLFLVPKLLEVETFGLYRIYMVYASYVGVLHLGVADGALLRWAGREPREITREWSHLAWWMLASQAAFAILCLAGAPFLTGGSATTIVIALGLTAICANSVTLASFALQAEMDFRSAGLLAVLPSTLFLASLLVAPSGSRSISVVLTLYVASQAVTGIVAASRLRHISPAVPTTAAGGPQIRSLVRIGGAVMVANFAGALSQSIDRILLSWAVPPPTFARYALAASGLFVATAAAQTVARVALPHGAALKLAARRQFFGGLHDLILSAYGLSLLAYPTFEQVLRIWLPAYEPSLPIMRALLCGALFWVGAQAVQATALQVARRVHVQVVLSMVSALCVSLAAGAAIVLRAPLWTLAAAASAGMIVGWAVSAGVISREIPEHEPSGAKRFALVGLLQYGALLAAFVLTTGAVRVTAVYAALTALPTFTAIRHARASVLRLAPQPAASSL